MTVRTNRPFTLDCVAFGVPFQLSAQSTELLAKMQQCVPFGTQPRSASDETDKRFILTGGHEETSYSLIVDGEIVMEGVPLQAVLDQIASDLIVHVANYAEDRVFVHAGVVAWRGCAMVFPGSSFAGKTTLVAELVRAGAIYYSDEYAVFDERGYVHPYARDLQMREVGGTEQRPLSISQLNGSTGVDSLPVSQIVFAEYVEGARWMPEPVSAGLAALEMMRHAIPIQRTPARVMATLAKVMATARAVSSTRGDAAETARTLLASMAECGEPV